MTALSTALRQGHMSSTMVVGMPARKPAWTVANTAWICPHGGRIEIHKVVRKGRGRHLWGTTSTLIILFSHQPRPSNPP